MSQRATNEQNEGERSYLNGIPVDVDASDSASANSGKKRKRSAFNIEPFVVRYDNRSQGPGHLRCCNKKMNLNPTRVRDHFRSCQSFQLKFRVDFIRLCGNEDTSSELSSLVSPISNHFHNFSPENKAEIDKAFAEAIILDGKPFSHLQSSNWKPFWCLVLGSALKLPGRDKISEHYLPIQFNAMRSKMISEM